MASGVSLLWESSGRTSQEAVVFGTEIDDYHFILQEVRAPPHQASAMPLSYIPAPYVVA